MRLKEVSESEKITYSKLAQHPLQSWEWGDFRNSYGTKTYRLGHYNGNKLLATFELTSHPIPKTGYVILVCFRSSVPSPEVLREFQDFGKAKSALCIKFEPNVNKLVNGIENKNFNRSKKYLLSNGCALGRAQFARYSFIIDLGKKEDDIFTNFNSKTRYNVRLASKHGVKVVEDNSPAAWDAYWRLTQETTQRQHFYSHNLHYHRLLWEHLKPAGMAHLLTATFHGEVLSTWMLFLFNDLLYYPYGAWSGKHKEVMARAFVGYKQTLEELGDRDKTLLKTHMDNLLKAMSENSATFLNPEGDKHPVFEAISSFFRPKKSATKEE